MRRAALLGALLALVAAPLAGQSRIGVGAEFGYTRASFGGAASEDLDSRSGATGGAFLEWAFSRGLSLTIGPALSARGGTSKVPGGAGNILAIDLETIDLPLLLRARIPVGSLGLLVAAGGAPAVRVSCNFEVQQSAVPMNRTPCSDAQVSSVADFSTWDILAVAGAGVGIPIAGSELALTFRMSRGFIPVIESQELYNQSWSVILSLPF